MTHAPSLPCGRPDAQAILGRTVDLERLDLERHGPELWQAIGADRSLWSDIPSGPFDDEASFAHWLSERSERPSYAIYPIIDKRGERPGAAGSFFLLEMDPAMGVVELGLVYGPALSRRIGGTEAFFLQGRYIFEILGYRRLEWRCNEAHEASKRAAARFGFTLEGVLRQNMWVKGANCDTAVYSILDREWPAVSARLSAWLSPENFSSDGSQIKALSAFA
jgi:RimJ/RimL family protein N-acetyltransferase